MQREAKIATSAIDLVKAIRTGDLDDANAFVASVQKKWFGSPPDTPETAIMTFRNGSPFFGYDTKIDQDASMPDDDEFAAWVHGEDEEESTRPERQAPGR